VATQLHVELVAVEEEVWSGEVEMVSARTTEGDLGILAHHAPLLGQLADPGDVRLKINEDETLAYVVNGGFLSVTEEGVTILAESCEPASESTI
jgi:F-type H+-transporting ATPase subunit epsilon